MTKPRVFNPRHGGEFGSDKDVAERLIEEAGGYKRVMALLNIGKGTVFSFADERDQAPASFIKYAQVRQLTAAGCITAAQDLATLAGGAFLPQPKGETDFKTLAQRYTRDHGETMAQIIAALGDGKVDAADARAVLAELHDDLGCVVQLIAVLQGKLGAGD